MMYGLVDCNNFFVSCERVFRPELIGRPVIVLSNNDGCAVALSNEAKALGFTRGNPYFQIRDAVERYNVAVLSGNHKLYGDMSARVMDTLRTLSEEIEIYSIDEAFFQVSDSPLSLHEYGVFTARTVRKNTGIPVSVGIAPTKTLAKVAAHFAKKYPGYKGACVIDSREKAEKALSMTEIKQVWGIGRKNARKLTSLGINTALQFAQLSEAKVRSLFAIPGVRTWRELNGTPAVLNEQPDAEKRTITSSRSFAADIHDIAALHQAMATFAEIAARKLREQDCYALEVCVFIATNRFHEYQEQYANSATCRIAESTNDTSLIAKAAITALNSIYRPEFGYKRAGITISKMVPRQGVQHSLFTDTAEFNRRSKLMSVMDSINRNIGNPDCIRLASVGNGLSDMTRKEHSSRLFTTRLSDIITINCSD